MHGAIPPSILAEALLIMAWKFLVFLAPIFVIAAVWWLVNQTERIMHYLFPYLEWEHSLGWLNIRAERRARMAMRWIGYLVYFLLAVTLLGLPLGAGGVEQLVDHRPDPPLTTDVAMRLATLFFSSVVWWGYLGCWLIPRLRAAREEAALKKFRAEMAEIEMEREERQPRSRIYSGQPKPRTNGAKPLVPDRLRRRR
jgi:hypothetical protein